MKKLLLVFIFSAGMCKNLVSQDYRFSQFYNAPLMMNPALTGDHNSNYRFFLNYKDQWSSISNSFRTMAGSIDMPAFESVGSTSKMGFGLTFLSDKAGTTNYGFNNINLSTAYHLKTTRFSQISAGLNLGYGQSFADLNSVKWENQHNGNNYDPSLPSGESVFTEQITFLDAGAGIAWSATDMVNDRTYKFGLSGSHLNFPNHSFIGQYQNRLKPKFQLHGEMDFGYEYVSIKPKFIIMNQGPSTSFTAGMMARFRTGNQADSRYTDAYVGSAFELGVFYRYNESVYICAQYEFKRNLLIGLSYDFIISDLAAASAAGGYEIALRYQGLFKNERLKVKKDIDGGQDEELPQQKENTKKNIRM